MRVLSIAALQTSPIAGDPEATLDQFEARVRTIRSTLHDVQLVLTPELYLSACAGLLDETAEYADEVAVEVPGPLTDRLGALARETGLWLVPGSVYERNSHGVQNTAVAIAPDGELVATYRKCFPWQPYEETVPGQQTVTFDIGGVGRVGLAICHDGVFPEVFRQLAWSGAELVLQPVLTGTSDREAEVVVARANAIVNQIHVVSLNAASPVANGRSVIVDPEGAVRYEAGSGEEVLTAAIDFDAVTRAQRYGSFGINRMWEQMDRHGPLMDLPMYGGRYRPRPGRSPAPDGANGRPDQEVKTS